LTLLIYEKPEMLLLFSKLIHREVKDKTMLLISEMGPGPGEEKDRKAMGTPG
jgi:hypothetical protein